MHRLGAWLRFWTPSLRSGNNSSLRSRKKIAGLESGLKTRKLPLAREPSFGRPAFKSSLRSRKERRKSQTEWKPDGDPFLWIMTPVWNLRESVLDHDHDARALGGGSS